MANKSIIVIDDFFKNAKEIREHALQLNYIRKEGAVYPGAESYSEKHDWEPYRVELRNHIDENVDAPCPKDPPFKQGKFRVAIKADEDKRLDYVHEDLQRWGAVIYLTLPKDCEGGVAYYKHKATKAIKSSPQWFNDVFPNISALPKEHRKQRILDEFKNPDNWEKIGQIPMQFNRAVILMARCFHGSTGVFGDTIAEGRLTQHFEFYSEND